MWCFQSFICKNRRSRNYACSQIKIPNRSKTNSLIHALHCSTDNDRCDFHINVTDTTELLSPQYGSNYPSDVICTWRLTAPAGKVIRLHFNQFALELSRRCFRDNIRIFDGVTSSADVIGQFCGRDIPDDVISTTSEILVFFFSDSSSEDLGFNISLSLENATGMIP